MTARADCECHMKGSGEEARGGKGTQISPAQKNAWPFTGAKAQV